MKKYIYLKVIVEEAQGKAVRTSIRFNFFLCFSGDDYYQRTLSLPVNA